MKEIYVGAAYYPELWDECEIEKDIARCKSLGINTLRVGEFAWSKMEPKEGEFHFEWLQNVVDRLYENGIYTVMCTPSCTPPRWLLDKYEETRLVNANNMRVDVSSRTHPCKTSPIMREKNRIIVEGMAKALAGRKGIIGWQIDNEFLPYGDGCFCPLCIAAFQQWLKLRYQDINVLNRAWGMYRWSLDYPDFDSVLPPRPHEWKHPSLRKAWWDFQCEQIVSYLEEQADILHRYGCENVGTDMMPNNILGYYKTTKALDVIMYNHYDPASNLINTAFSYDFLRCVKDKPFWVTETQVGWNGSEYADCGYRPIGGNYANTWLPIAKGAEMNLYWLFRAHPNGHEIGHGALYSAAGRQYRVSEETAQACKDFEKCKEFLHDGKIKSKIAMHYSSTAMNSFAYAPILKGLNYRDTVMKKFYRAFDHYNVDVIDTPHSLDGYEVVISPFLSTVDENGLKERVIEWVKEGGTWIVGPMSDIMNEDISRYTNAPYSFLEELVGVYTKYQKPIDNDVFRAKWKNGDDCKIGTCFDAYELQEGTESLVDYDGDEFGGLSVVAQRKVGKGKVILLGSVVSHDDLRRLVGFKPIAEASDNLSLVERSGAAEGIIAVETDNRDGYIVLDGTYTNLLDGKTYCGKVEMKPYQVCVLAKKA